MFHRLSAISSLVLGAGALLSLAGAASCGGSDFEPETGGGSGGIDGGSGSSGSSGSGGTGASVGGGGTGASSGSGGASGGTGTDPNGTACTSGDTCASGFCVDGVCCAEACDGACQSCDLAGSKGACAAHESGTDPESDCLGTGQAGGACIGTCNGQGACAFPGTTTSCGDAVCASGKQTEYFCSGDGSCSTTETECGEFACGATACKTSCAGAADCAASAWCNGTKCESKKANGASCGGANQCTSNFCEGQYCCATACPVPGSCSTGTCLCGGVSCPAGKKCILYHLDQDGDGFGAPSSFSKPGCEGQAPSDPGGKTYYPETAPQDCDDTNPLVKPGQTQWFTVPYGANNWDYNCSNTTEYQYPTSTATSCNHCCTSSICATCDAGNWYLGGCTNQKSAFGSFVGCGQTGTLKSCTNNCQPMTTTTAKQGCR
jgi:hypothetical protein